MTTSNRYSLFLLCLIALLLVAGSTQRGGSRSSSPSSRSGSSYRRSGYLHKFTTGPYFLAFLAIFGLMMAYSYFSSKKDEQKNEQRRKEIIEGELKDFQGRVQQIPSSLDEVNRSMMLDTFMKQAHAMEIIVGDNSQKFYCQLKVLDLKRESQIKYLITMSGTDEIGSFILQGVMIFWSVGMGFKLSKVYDDRRKANQTGSFDILLFEGTGTPQCFKGEWAFYGHQSQSKYSGTWIMLELKEI